MVELGAAMLRGGGWEVWDGRCVGSAGGTGRPPVETSKRRLTRVLYAMDLDSVRSTVWLIGVCSLVAIGAAPFFGFTEYLQ